jgi:hypothetical protein
MLRAGNRSRRDAGLSSYEPPRSMPPKDGSRKVPSVNHCEVTLAVTCITAGDRPSTGLRVTQLTVAGGSDAAFLPCALSKAGNVSQVQFIRTSFNRLRVVESLCLRCGHTVAFAPTPDPLKIAEEAHVCDRERNRLGGDVTSTRGVMN